MRCPKCKASETRVIETRTADEGRIVRRRRECPQCSSRFTTYERVEEKKVIWISKKDGRREAFDREKIFRGVRKACEKRSISLEKMEEVVCKVEDGLLAAGAGEIPSSIIGELVMEELAELDKVAYVRFASVYREFSDLASFQREISDILDRKRNI
ncbi:transcriptional regulator NrdR [Dethiosulfovibrio sp. F2B]|uniref:transcriptional regulator NrdR n=1 Tax=Dethiosulfovibrio faecalis TaxID=2720018 RepID=UPI001F2B1469|nr:transcriptional regulator NrdR [Dethiosulfovibrio faecalis]